MAVEQAGDEAPPVFQPPAGNPRFPLFDSVRGIAALMVVITHAGLLAGANDTTAYGPYVARLEMALTLFFVTSGFLLYRPYVAQKLGVGRAPKLANYARNRVLRIVPAYWLAITVLGIYPGLGGFWTSHTWSYYAFAQEWDRGWSFGGIIPTWSLTVEVTYYLVLPLLAWLMLRVTSGRTRAAKIRGEAVLFAVLIAIGVAYRLIVRHAIGDDPTSNVWAFLPGSIDWLAIGMGLAALSAALQAGVRKPALIALIERRPGICWIAAAVLFWVAARGIGLDGRFPQPVSTRQWVTVHELYGVIAALIVAPAVFGDSHTGLVRRVLRWRPLAWFGMVSYGVFLYHHPILVALNNSSLADRWRSAPMLGLTVAGLLIATACAAVSYYLVERPLLRLKRTRQNEPGASAPAPAVPAGSAG